jgi:hypothetical protein
MRNISLIAATVAAFAMGGGAALAKAVDALDMTDTGTCLISDLTESTDCEGAYAGNDDAAYLDLLEVFGETGWSQVAKVEGDSGTDGGLTVAVTTENDAGEGITGTWAYTGDISTVDHVIAVLKAGSSFTAYLLDTSVDPFEGTWSTAGLDDKGLSHFSLYTRTDGGGVGVEPVPLPAAAWMLLVGVGGLAAMARRRKAAA